MFICDCGYANHHIDSVFGTLTHQWIRCNGCSKLKGVRMQQGFRGSRRATADGSEVNVNECTGLIITKDTL